MAVHWSPSIVPATRKAISLCRFSAAAQHTNLPRVSPDAGVVEANGIKYHASHAEQRPRAEFTVKLGRISLVDMRQPTGDGF